MANFGKPENCSCFPVVDLNSCFSKDFNNIKQEMELEMETEMETDASPVLLMSSSASRENTNTLPVIPVSYTHLDVYKRQRWYNYI